LLEVAGIVTATQMARDDGFRQVEVFDVTWLNKPTQGSATKTNKLAV
jgi:hypothetical protein